MKPVATLNKSDVVKKVSPIAAIGAALGYDLAETLLSSGCDLNMVLSIVSGRQAAVDCYSDPEEVPTVVTVRAPVAAVA